MKRAIDPSIGLLIGVSLQQLKESIPSDVHLVDPVNESADTSKHCEEIS